MDMKRLKDDEKLYICQRYFYGGFALLPFLWVVNSVWFFDEAFISTKQYPQKKQVQRLVLMSIVAATLSVSTLIGNPDHVMLLNCKKIYSFILYFFYLALLSRIDSLIGFGLCIGMGLICFILASFYLPFIVLKARKFCLLFTLGSVFWLISFTFIYGPKEHAKQLFSKERAIFTSTYVASLIATLYAALVLKLTLLTILSSTIQVVALSWYIFSYFPGGTTALWMFSKGFTRVASQTLPV